MRRARWRGLGSGAFVHARPVPAGVAAAHRLSGPHYAAGDLAGALRPVELCGWVTEVLDLMVDPGESWAFVPEWLLRISAALYAAEREEFRNVAVTTGNTPRQRAGAQERAGVGEQEQHEREGKVRRAAQ